MQEIDWEVVVRDYGPMVWRTGYRLLGERSAADDCFGQVFLEAFTASKNQKIRKPGPFLCRVATFRAIDMLRKRKIKSTDQLDVEMSSYAGPAERAENKELVEQLREGFKKLSGREAEVFCLRHLNGFSYLEIAKEMDMTVTGVGVTLIRARNKLRLIMSTYKR